MLQQSAHFKNKEAEIASSFIDNTVTGILRSSEMQNAVELVLQTAAQNDRKMSNVTIREAYTTIFDDAKSSRRI